MCKPKAINRDKLVAFVLPVNGRTHTPACLVAGYGWLAEVIADTFHSCGGLSLFSFDTGTLVEEEKSKELSGAAE